MLCSGRMGFAGCVAVLLACWVAVPASGRGRRFEVHFEDTPLPEALRVMARVSGRNFILPAALLGRSVTLRAGQALEADEALGAFLHAMEKAGLGTEPRGAFLLVVERPSGERMLEWIEKQAVYLGLEILEMAPVAADPGGLVRERTEVRLRLADLASLLRLLDAITRTRADLIVDRVAARSVFWEPDLIDARFRVSRLRQKAELPHGPDVTARLRAILACLRQAGGLQVGRFDLGPTRIRMRGTTPGPGGVAEFLRLLSARPGFEQVDPGRFDLDPVQRQQVDAIEFKVDLDLEAR